MSATRSSRGAARSWKAPKPPLERGYWKLYVDHVQQADQGADLDFLVGKSGPFVPRDNRRNAASRRSHHPPASRRRRRHRAHRAAAGTMVAEGERARRGARPAGHKIAVRAVQQGEPVHRYNQIIGFATQDDRAGRSRARAQRRDGRLRSATTPSATLRSRRDYIDAAGDLHGHRARRRPRRDAQLHRHPHERELLGDRRAHDRRAFREPAGRLSRTSTASWR